MRIWWLSGLALLALGAGIARAQGPAIQFYPEEDRKELDALQGKPGIELDQVAWVQGGPLRVTDQKGKVVLLDFWSVWCPPCREAALRAQELQAKYGPQGLVVVGIHSPKVPANLKKMLDQSKITYPVGVEGYDRMDIKSYRVLGYPTFTLIGRDGKIRYVDVLFDSLEPAIETLVKEPAAPVKAPAQPPAAPPAKP